jgi:hypothetical protein
MMDNYLKKGGFTLVKDSTMYPNMFRRPRLLAASYPRVEESTPVCTLCFREVWFHFVFRYMTDKMPEMSADVRQKLRCWYGINCRTMLHNSAHCSRFFHIVPQSHFN